MDKSIVVMLKDGRTIKFPDANQLTHEGEFLTLRRQEEQHRDSDGKWQADGKFIGQLAKSEVLGWHWSETKVEITEPYRCRCGSEANASHYPV